jgi:hypothetical protein
MEPESAATRDMKREQTHLRGNRSMDSPFGVEDLTPKDERRAKKKGFSWDTV